MPPNVFSAVHCVKMSYIPYTTCMRLGHRKTGLVLHFKDDAGSCGSPESNSQHPHPDPQTHNQWLTAACYSSSKGSNALL